MKILFLSANPPGSARLDLDKEVSKIEDGLQRSKLNGRFQLVSKWAIDSNALRRALLEENPEIVHFSGHGEGQAGLVLLGQDGQAKPATGEALSGLFRQFPNIKCVLLNACYAEVQAKAIVQHIDYVVGMKQAVRDDVAIAFATGFYDGLGYGKSIDVAFELGRNAVQFELASFSVTTRSGQSATRESRKLIPVNFEKLEPLPDHLVPVLLKKEAGLVGNFTGSTPSSAETNLLSEKLQTKNDGDKADAMRTYRERVQEFLADRKLTQIERFQLAILAKVLGLSETDANRILQEEQNKQQHDALFITNNRSWFTRISNAKKLIGCAVLLIAAGGFLVHRQPSTNYPLLQKYLQQENLIDADEETAEILWKIAGRQQERNLRVEDFEKISCSDLRAIDDLWEEYSKKRFGFGVQRRIWLSSDVNSDLGKFVAQVGWGERKEDGSFVYWFIDHNSFEDKQVGKLPWKVTYEKGNNETRKSYLKRISLCLGE
jgi:hypothetical protein